MKKKNIIIVAIITASFLVVSAIVGFAVDDNINTIKSFEPEKKIFINDDFLNDPMIDFLKNSYEDKEEQKKAILQYVNSKTFEEFTPNECNEIYSHVCTGEDFYNVINTYLYCRNTVEGTEIVEELLKKAPDENPDNYLWLSEAYDEMTNYIHGTLEKDEIQQYKNKGITDEEIMFADSLSKKGIGSIKEILNDFNKKSNWLSSIYSAYPQIEKAQSIFSKINVSLNKNLAKDYEHIMMAYELSKYTDYNMAQLLFYNTKEEVASFYESYVTYTTAKIYEELCKAGIIEHVKTEENIVFENKMKDKINELGLSYEEIDELCMEYDVITVHNAVVMSNNEGISLDEALEVIDR